MKRTNTLKSALCSILFFCSAVGASAQAANAKVHRITTSAYILEATDNSSVVSLKSVDGAREYLQLGKLKVMWTPLIDPIGCTYEIKESDDHKVLVAYYKLEESLPKGIAMKGSFMCTSDGIDIRYDITGIPSNFVKDWGGSTFDFVPGIGATPLETAKLGLWQRDRKGGLPYEVADGKLQSMTVDGKTFTLAFGDDNKPFPPFDGKDSRHTVLSKVDDHTYTTSLSLLVNPSTMTAQAINAKWKHRKVALTLSTDKPYNWWDNANETLVLKADIFNATAQRQQVKLNYWVRNFAGDFLVKKSETLTLKPMRVTTKAIDFRSTTPRDIFIADVSVENVDGLELAFSRTSLTMLPPHVFHSTPENSIMGLSAHWAYPDSVQMHRLLKRMGVKWLRSGNVKDYDNITTMYHNNIEWDVPYSDKDRDEFIRKSFEDMVRNGSTVWEFANEINMMKPGGIALAGGGIGRGYRAGQYVEWLKAIRRIQNENPEWKKIKIITFGLAGLDKVFLDSLYIKGGWDLVDGVALHPGRGNFTADYPVVEPWTDWAGMVNANEKNYTDFYFGGERKKLAQDVTSDDAYWNYYGSLRLLKDFIKKHGGNKDIYLTEVYALDWPNCWWNDTPRSATSNIVLSYALAAAENVKNALYYQLFNSVWFDQMGVKADEREYYFGLVNRDMSFKPLLVAFCTIAEALDEAKFKGWIKFADKANAMTRALLFDTPRGPMAVMWDRSEGYVMSEKSDQFISTDQWVPQYSKEVSVTLPASADKITLVNTIGQERTLESKNAKASLKLTGEPVIVYGLDESKMKLWK